MEKQEYRKMFELEDRYWWFAGRRHLVRRLLEELDLPRQPRILDAGCGTGAGLDNLDRFAPAFGFDCSDEALEFCRQRGKRRLFASTLEDPGILPESFDVITILDVLEHVDMDEKVLSSLLRILRPGGKLIITVPAYPFLWSEHDEALHHKRRYRTLELRRKVLEAGFHIRRMSGLVSSFLPVIIAFRLFQKIFPRPGRPQASFVELPSLLNGILKGILMSEVELSRRLAIPFGCTLYIVAERPATVRIPVKETVLPALVAASPASGAMRESTGT